MITFKTKIKSFKVPNSWLDLTYLEYLNLVSLESVLDQSKLLTGLNDFELSSIDLAPITEALKFLTEPIEDIEESNYINDATILPEDIGELSFEKKINVIEAIQNNNIIEVINIYSGVDVSNKSCFDVFGNYNFIENQVKAIIEKESEMLKSTVTYEQQLAGVDAFDVLKDFNIIDKIAQDYNYTHAEVEQLSYNLVFLILLKSNISTKFEQRYSEIMQNKK